MMYMCVVRRVKGRNYYESCLCVYHRDLSLNQRLARMHSQTEPIGIHGTGNLNWCTAGSGKGFRVGQGEQDFRCRIFQLIRQTVMKGSVWTVGQLEIIQGYMYDRTVGCVMCVHEPVGRLVAV